MVIGRGLTIFVTLLLASFANICNAAPAEPLTYQGMVYRCESFCKSAHPTNGVPSTKTTDTPHTLVDHDDVKFFACLEACRMAVTVYPKSEGDMQKYSFQK